MRSSNKQCRHLEIDDVSCFEFIKGYFHVYICYVSWCWDPTEYTQKHTHVHMYNVCVHKRCAMICILSKL